MQIGGKELRGREGGGRENGQFGKNIQIVKKMKRKRQKGCKGIGWRSGEEDGARDGMEG